MGKSKERRLFTIQWMMIISFLILAGFVGYWIDEQYFQQKEVLRKELMKQLKDSEQQLMDTILLQKFIHPVLGMEKRPQDSLFRDSLKEIRIFRATPGSGIQSNKVPGIRMRQVNDSCTMRIDLQHASKNSFAHASRLTRNEEIVFSTDSLILNDPDKLMLRGVKLFVNVLHDSIGGRAGRFLTISDSRDSTEFVGSFNRKVMADRMKAVWISVRDSEAGAGVNTLVFTSDLFDRNMAVEIRHYTAYLLRKIWPQMLFSLLLLLLTGGSFYFSYRNLRQQYLLNDLRNGFVANMSHELRTPVSTIKLALEAIQKYQAGDDPVRKDEYLAMAISEAGRLEEMVEKVLTSAVLQQEGLFLHMEKTDLRRLAEITLENLQPRIRKEEAEISFHKEAGPFFISGDSFHLQGVLASLLDNSLKYAEGRARIMVSLVNNKGRITLTVKDSGKGIPVEFLPRVFDRFFRVPAEDRHNVKGYGLGLSYVAMVMKLHHGTVQVVNNPGEKGCSFILTFDALEA